MCGPSRTSFLTSRRPDTTKLYDFETYWRTDAGNFTTLPEYFKLNGYKTYSFGKVFHPGKVSNGTLDYPYSWSSRPYVPSTQKYKNDPVCRNMFNTTDPKLYSNIVCPINVDKLPEGTLPDIQVVNAAVRKLKRISKNPFFMAVGFHKPHIPFKIPES